MPIFNVLCYRKSYCIWIKSEKVKGRSQGNAAADDLFVVMQRAHTEDPSAQFIRGIRTAPDPAIVLASDLQVDDMIRFCTSSKAKFCVLTIDPTFSLGCHSYHLPSLAPRIEKEPHKSDFLGSAPCSLPQDFWCILVFCFDTYWDASCTTRCKSIWNRRRASTCRCISSWICIFATFNMFHTCKT